MKLKCLLVIAAIFFIAIFSLAQDDSYKSKRVVPADFPEKVSSNDSNASMIISANTGLVIFYNN